MPYLYGKAVEAHEHGMPMMRPMMLEFPDDPACDMLDRQYMLGDSLLVAPVFRKDGEVQYYLPDGTWTSLLDGGKVEGRPLADGDSRLHVPAADGASRHGAAAGRA